MSPERLEQRCEIKARLNLLYRMKRTASKTGLGTGFFDDAIFELESELRRKEKTAWAKKMITSLHVIGLKNINTFILSQIL